jgi:surfeit locus 1 family protein
MFRFLFLILVGGGGLAILLSLGIWQMQRLAWKEGLLEKIQAQIEAPVAPLPVSPNPETDRYLPVYTQGRFRPGLTVKMLASRRQIGAVYRHIAAFDLESGGAILVDIGWMRADYDLTDLSPASLRVEGNLDWPNEGDGFTPPPDEENRLWYARDIASLSTFLDTQPILLVLREKPPLDVSAPPWPTTPWPVDAADIPNDHLQYAVTWFSLAAIWAAMTFYFLHRNRRRA